MTRMPHEVYRDLYAGDATEHAARRLVRGPWLRVPIGTDVALSEYRDIRAAALTPVSRASVLFPQAVEEWTDISPVCRATTRVMSDALRRAEV